MSGTVRVEHDAGVVRLTLARAEANNAVDGPMAAALSAAVSDVAARCADGAAGGAACGSAAGVRCVLLLAEGPNFCVGGDVRTFGPAAGEDPGARIGALARAFHDIQRGILGLPVPLVVGARGWIAGAGIGLALTGDVVVLGASTRLRPAYLGIGLSPDGGSSWFLTRALGAARARDVFLTNGFLRADEALAAGLASRVVADEDVERVAAEVAATIAAGPQGAIRRTRELVRAAQGGDWPDGFLAHLDAEAEAIAASAAEPDGIEGVRAFVERRQPRFGR